MTRQHICTIGRCKTVSHHPPEFLSQIPRSFERSLDGDTLGQVRGLASRCHRLNGLDDDYKIIDGSLGMIPWRRHVHEQWATAVDNVREQSQIERAEMHSRRDPEQDDRI